jgi:hypothetical protein
VNLTIRGIGLGLAVGLALAACGSARPSPKTATFSPATSSRAASSIPQPAWPRHPRVVGTIRAIEPRRDDILLFKPILLAAVREACADLTSVETAVRVGARGTRHILVRCGDNRVRALRLVFTGVAVPNMRSSPTVGMNEPQSTLAMLGLRWDISRRSMPGGHPGALIHQEPPAGTVVPLGTIVRAVYVR